MSTLPQEVRLKFVDGAQYLLKLERRTSRLSCLHISLSIEPANNLFDCFSYCIADLAVNNTVLRLGQIICVGYSTRYGGALFVPLIGYRQSTLVRELHLRCALLSIVATTTSSTSRSCVLLSDAHLS